VKRTLILTTGLLALLSLPSPSPAQWGWPPPGYSTSTFVAPDGSRYRRLCEVLRGRKKASPSHAVGDASYIGPPATAPNLPVETAPPPAVLPPTGPAAR
jgi:hypothetical protein